MSKWKEWKDSLGEARPWHLLDPDRVIKDQEVINLRMDFCNSCDFLIKATKQCNKCGCFMTMKTTIASAECPIGKWGKEENDR